jgi:hypothetical protein
VVTPAGITTMIKHTDCCASRSADGRLPNDNFLAEYKRLGGSRLAATA